MPPTSLPGSGKSIKEIETLRKLRSSNQDPNLDFLIAVAEKNEAKAQAAEKAGADPSIEFVSIIMKYSDQIDPKLLAELICSYDNPQPRSQYMPLF